MLPSVIPGPNILSLVFCLLTSLYCISVDARHQKITVKIAVFLDQSDESNATQGILDKTINLINKNQTRYQLELKVYRELNNKHIFEAGEYACNSIKEGIAAIVGPESAHTNDIIQAVSSYFQIPYFLTFSGYPFQKFTTYRQNDNKRFTFNLHPSLQDIARCIATVVEQNDWRSYTVIYESDETLVRIKEALKRVKPRDPKVSFRKLGSGPDYRAVLKQIKKSKETRILLDCKIENLANILKQAREIHLLEEYYNYMLTNLDSHTLNWSEFLGVSANITSIKLLDSVPRDWTFRNKPIRTKSSLLHDSLILFNKVIAKMETEELNFKPLNCYEDEKADHGRQFSELVKKETNYMSQSGFLSGPIKFDQFGQRNHYTLHITEFNKSDVSFIVTGTWDPSFPNTISFKRTEQERLQILEKSIQDKEFKVVSRLGPPYLMLRSEPGKFLYGNARFEGYALDLMSEICKIWNCTYSFELVPDGQYGQYNRETKEWDGLIKHLLDRKAELAVCDLTITYDRRRAVDFTLPFMTLGISILYSKTVKEPPELLSFLNPLSLNVWLYMVTSYLIISIIIFLVARLNPHEWENPHPCDLVPEELENIWNIRNCCWLTLGSIMAQGCDILPKGISTRMVTAMWWFFSLIMTASYTANMAAFLTMERMGPTIESAEDLASQAKIKYGCLSGGSTYSFFKESNFSTFHRMWVQMEGADPTVFEKTNDDGVKRVVNNTGKYAFLMESSSIEYQTERICSLRQVGNQLDSKGYGIAMPKDFQYRKALNEAILRMQEMGVLHTLKTKWWKTMNGGGQCGEHKDSGEAAAAELGLDHVGGVFVVLYTGICIALAIAMCEFIWLVRKVTVKEHINVREAFLKEIKFAFNIWARQKGVLKEAKPSVGFMEQINDKK